MLDRLSKSGDKGGDTVEMSIISEKLEDIRNYLDVEVHPVVSPDRWDVYSTLCDMVDGIITLLKAQEQKPISASIVDSDGGLMHWWACGNCQAPINPEDKFCHECGRAVKWE